MNILTKERARKHQTCMCVVARNDGRVLELLVKQQGVALACAVRALVLLLMLRMCTVPNTLGDWPTAKVIIFVPYTVGDSFHSGSRVRDSGCVLLIAK